MTSEDPSFGGDFLGQILAAPSLPGAFLHSRILVGIDCSNIMIGTALPWNPKYFDYSCSSSLGAVWEFITVIQPRFFPIIYFSENM